ncbi:PD-(D/E)XK nuclease family protein [Candidatus Collierbacteria bacterium]|nr:PD-(D/E)XK nuclease family protein [Candidatus Collierbacteria bacterium]
MADKYSAVWVSHTSISDFINCPRNYYLKNVYKDPATNHKIQIMAPPLALGQAVHEVIESLSVLTTKSRFDEPLGPRFEMSFIKISGRRGGFLDVETEYRYKQRGLKMLKDLEENPGPLKNLAVKISMDLPYYYLSEEDNIILCGKIDWLEYLPGTDSVHVIDFKTSKGDESKDSLQLPIYHLLVHNTQKRKVSKASYWYLERGSLIAKELPDLMTAHKKVLKIAKKIKLSRQLERFKCPNGEAGCRYCEPMEAILRNKAEFVGTNDYGQDVYILNKKETADKESVIL